MNVKLLPASVILTLSRAKGKNPVLYSTGSFASCLRRQALRMTIVSFLILHFTFLIALATPAHAQIPLSPLQPGLQDDILGVARSAAGLGVPALEEVDIRVYAMRLVKGVLLFIGLIVIIMVMYGGFMYMTAGGNEERLTKATQIITRAAIGTGIVLSSYAIVFFVSRTLQRTIFQNLNQQVQNCSTQGGSATCCREFVAFQSAGTISYTSGNINEQAARNREEAQERYEEWQECQERDNAGPREAARRAGNFFRNINPF